jgi:hypothetical protein
METVSQSVRQEGSQRDRQTVSYIECDKLLVIVTHYSHSI